MIQEQTEPEIVTIEGKVSPHIFPVYKHIDNCEDVELSDTSELHIYAFDHEEAKDEIDKVIHKFKKRYIFAVGVVFPDWMEGRVQDLSVEKIQTIEQMMAMGHQVAPSDIEEMECQ